MRRAQRGYALLMVIFMVALVIIMSAAVVPDIMQQGRREREKELIFRGKQFDRGIKMYYKKLGKYPTSLDDLFKELPGNLHLMRKAYKDPMNPVDGSWRLIYIGNGGQLINSLMFTSLADMAQKLKPPYSQGGNTGVPMGGAPPLGGGPPGGNGQQSQSGFGSFGGGNSFSNSNNSQNNNQTQGQNQNSGNTQGGNQPGQTGGSGNSSDSNQQNGDSSGQVFGGNLIGVASKINKPSIKIFQKGKTYKTWEFIWNSQMEQAAGAPGGLGGLGSGTPGGSSPAGSAPGGLQNPGGSSFGGSSFGGTGQGTQQPGGAQPPQQPSQPPMQQ